MRNYLEIKDYASRDFLKEKIKNQNALLIFALIILFIGASYLENYFVEINATHYERFEEKKEQIKKQKEEYIDAEISAYSSTIDQTDDTPFITASGERVRNGIVANNCLEFGTKVKIYNQIYEVKDRMNKRYGCENFDIWMESREQALEHGRINHQVIVLKQW